MPDTIQVTHALSPGRRTVRSKELIARVDSASPQRESAEAGQ